MTGHWTHLAPRARTGSIGFRLHPTDDLALRPAELSVRPAADGHALVVDYHWEHPDDGAQADVLMAGSPAEDGSLTVTFVDSWHQKPEPLMLSGEAREEGFHVTAEYAEGWWWEVELAGGADLVMRNVVPRQEDGSGGEAYDVMVWSA